MNANRPLVVRRSVSSTSLWLFITAGVAVVVRLLMLVGYQSVAFSDTPSYRRLADTVLQGFANYDGTRTPGYPAFLALTGTDQHAWIAQLILGFIATLLLFFIGWKLTERPWFGGLIALIHTLNLGQVFFEANLLTESLTTFLMILSTAGLFAWLLFPPFRKLWLAFILGIVSSLTILVRPLFIYLPVLIILALWLEPWMAKHASGRISEQNTSAPLMPTRNPPWRISLAFIIPVLLLVGGWISFIHDQFHVWSLTTMTGYHLVQHTGNFFEYVPDQYASLRDTYIKYRNDHIARYGTQTNTIWDAIPEMSKVSGYSFYGLSRVLTSISIQLILHHPFLFIKSAISGWWMFWRVPVYWSAEALRFPALVPVVKIAILLQRGILFLINLIFIGGSLLFAIIEIFPSIRRRAALLTPKFTNNAQYIFMWVLLANIWVASILQTLLDHGDNPRFLVPLQSLVVLWVCAYIFQIMKSWQSPRTQNLPS